MLTLFGRAMPGLLNILELVVEADADAGTIVITDEREGDRALGGRIRWRMTG